MVGHCGIGLRVGHKAIGCIVCDWGLLVGHDSAMGTDHGLI